MYPWFVTAQRANDLQTMADYRNFLPFSALALFLFLSPDDAPQPIGLCIAMQAARRQVLTSLPPDQPLLLSHYS